MVKSHYNILFLYLGYKGTNLSPNTLGNHIKIIQEWKAGLKKGFLHVRLSPLVLKTEVFQEGSHLKLIYLKEVTTGLFLQEERNICSITGFHRLWSPLDFHEASLITTESSHSRLGVSMGQVQPREVAFFPSFLADAANCWRLHSSHLTVIKHHITFNYILAYIVLEKISKTFNIC